MGTSYAFGDTTAARRRLDLVAAVFDPPSRAFLAAATASGGPPSFACDLGCGPGNTTRLVQRVTGARRVTGLDSSPAFIQAAAERWAPLDTIEFGVWTAADPLPAGPDLVYARLLLAHLPSPRRLVASWASQLRPGGQLLLDEVERIDTSDDTLRDYLDIVTARVRDSGAQMCAGPLLAGLERSLPGDCRVERDQVVRHPVEAADAARMFLLNLSVWGDTSQPEVARTRAGLTAIVTGEVPAEITWRMRQAAIRRGAGRA